MALLVFERVDFVAIFLLPALCLLVLNFVQLRIVLAYHRSKRLRDKGCQPLFVEVDVLAV